MHFFSHLEFLYPAAHYGAVLPADYDPLLVVGAPEELVGPIADFMDEDERAQTARSMEPPKT